MKKFSSYSLILIFSIIPVFLHAQLSVSYQIFQPDDVVIEVGQWKMTAKELEKYGIEPLKVVMVNDGNTDETCVPDRQYLLPYDVYKRLKYYAGPSWIKIYGCPLVSFYVVGPALLIIMFPQEVQEIDQLAETLNKNFSVQAVIQSVKAVAKIAIRMGSTAPVKTLFWGSGTLGISLLIREYFIRSAGVSNRALFSYIHQEMFFESCHIPAHTSMTKLILVAKEQGKNNESGYGV